MFVSIFWVRARVFRCKEVRTSVPKSFCVWGCVGRCKKVCTHVCRSSGYAPVFVSLLGYAIVLANDVGIQSSTSQHLQTLVRIPKTCKTPATPKDLRRLAHTQNMQTCMRTCLHQPTSTHIPKVLKTLTRIQYLQRACVPQDLQTCMRTFLHM